METRMIEAKDIVAPCHDNDRMSQLYPMSLHDVAFLEEKDGIPREEQDRRFALACLLTWDQIHELERILKNGDRSFDLRKEMGLKGLFVIQATKSSIEHLYVLAQMNLTEGD